MRFTNPLLSNFNGKYLLKHFFQKRSYLNRLIIINLAVYFVFLILKYLLSLIGFLMSNDFDEVVLSKIVLSLSFPASIHNFLYRPWSIITSLFFHIHFWHILFNMLMFWIAGRIFLQYISEKKLLLTYLLGGVFGNLVYAFAYNIFPVFQNVLPTSIAFGASGSIMAILAAITVYKPQYNLQIVFLGPIKLKWITIIFIVIDLLSISKSNAGGHIAHLGGVLYGATYMFFSMKNNIYQTTKKKKKKYCTSYDTRPLSDEEYNAKKKAENDRIDAILDKISKNGYDALTAEEKEFLFSKSRK